MTNWPRQRDVPAWFGDPRDPLNAARVSAEWQRKNLVQVKALPFRVTYAGHPVSGITCHRKVAEAFRAVLEDIWAAAGRDQRVVDDWGVSIFGGSFAFRTKRGLKSLSMHAYGIAFDFDPARNALGDRTPHFGQCPAVLAAWRKAGAVWGGDWDGDGSSADEPRCDGMHWQFARL